MVRPAGQPAAAARAPGGPPIAVAAAARLGVGRASAFSRRGAAALWLTFASLVVWSLGAGVIQAWVIRAGLRRWTAEESVAALAQPRSERPAEAQARPHALAFVGLAFVGLAIAGFAAALASTDALAIGVIGAVLAIAWTFTQRRTPPDADSRRLAGMAGRRVITAGGAGS